MAGATVAQRQVNREDNSARQHGATQDNGSVTQDKKYSCPSDPLGEALASPDGSKGHLEEANSQDEDGAMQCFSPEDLKVPLQNPPKEFQLCCYYLVECSNC